MSVIGTDWSHQPDGSGGPGQVRRWNLGEQNAERGEQRAAEQEGWERG